MQVSCAPRNTLVVQTTLGERLALARKRAGLSQEALAAAIGLGDRTTVSKWERDEVVPDGRFLLKLPDVLGVSADWLFLGRVGPGAPSLPPEALEALRDWMDQMLPPKRGRKEGGGNGDSA
jgi:transcriptional regulator with XRE-family HTH domain